MVDEREMRFEPGLKLARHNGFGKYLNGELVYPINIEISPSGVCDASCKNCFYRQDSGELKGLDKGFFKESRMEGLVNEFMGVGVKSISWTGGGEPTLHPSFSKFIEWANWAKIKQGLFTNALKSIKYDPTLFEWIRVTKTNKSLNEEVLKDLRQCKTLGICINYGGKQDEEIINNALEVAERLDVLKKSEDHSTYVQVRPALKIKGKSIKVEIPSRKHTLLLITEYKFLGSNLKRSYTNCEAYHFSPFIWQDGDVDVCGYHRKEAEFNLGNLHLKGKEGRFSHIMENAPKNVKVADDCQVCCKLNSMNSMIELMKNLKDVDFP